MQGPIGKPARRPGEATGSPKLVVPLPGGSMRDNWTLVPDWFPPFLAASLAIFVLNIALLVQRRRGHRRRWDRRLLRELRAWDGRLPEELSPSRRQP
jgi:hypothetical protein